MTTEQYWAKMDQIFDSKSLSSVQKKDELAKVLKTDYDVKQIMPDIKRGTES